ncbi:MAG: hypothetical protein R2702_18420 [Acidimicrobiales bacterium]
MDRTKLFPSLGATMSTGLGRARALGALAAVGLPAFNLERADSVTNEVWLTDDYVVRVNRDASLRLHREAVLSQVLPDEVGYPTLIQHGGETGSDWLVVTRLPGVPLSRAWPEMSVASRREAVRQISSGCAPCTARSAPGSTGSTTCPSCSTRPPPAARPCSGSSTRCSGRRRGPTSTPG